MKHAVQHNHHHQMLNSGLGSSYILAGALDTNEKPAIFLCKLRHFSEQIFYCALFPKQGFGIGAHVLIACHTIRPWWAHACRRLMSFLRKLHCSSEGNDRENGHIALSCKRFIVSRVQPIRTHTLTRRCTYTFFIVSLHHQHHFCHIGDAIWKLHLSL